MKQGENAAGIDQGFALISVLITVAIVATIAATLMYRQLGDVRRSTQILHKGQVLNYVLAAEEAAIAMLAQDAANGNYDTLTEAWALPITPTDIAGGAISLRLSDLQGRFNINNIYYYQQDIEKSTADKANYDFSLAQLQRWLQLTNIDEQTLLKNLELALRDWMDADTNLLQDSDLNAEGAEDDYYRLARPPLPAYQSAGYRFSDCRELGLLRYFRDMENRTIVETLLDSCIALPVAVAVNVNTANGDTLRTLSDKIDQSLTNTIMRERFITAFEEVDDFYTLLATQTADSSEQWEENIPANMLTAVSSFFLMIADITVGVSHVRSMAVIHRHATDGIRVIQRSVESL